MAQRHRRWFRAPARCRPEVGVPWPACRSAGWGSCRDLRHRGTGKYALSPRCAGRCRCERPHRENWPAFPGRRAALPGGVRAETCAIAELGSTPSCPAARCGAGVNAPTGRTGRRSGVGAQSGLPASRRACILTATGGVSSPAEPWGVTAVRGFAALAGRDAGRRPVASSPGGGPLSRAACARTGALLPCTFLSCVFAAASEP